MVADVRLRVKTAACFLKFVVLTKYFIVVRQILQTACILLGLCFPIGYMKPDLCAQRSA